MAAPLQLLWLPALLLLADASTAQPGTWRLVQDTPGSWIALSESALRSEFYLRPVSRLLSAVAGGGCPNASTTTISLELWSQRLLDRARRALTRQGVCREDDRCQVLPLKADRIAVRDQRGRLETLTPWYFVAGPLPMRKTFVLYPSTDRTTAADACSKGQPRNLTAAELEQLDSLYLEVVQATDSDAAAGGRVAINFDDVQWAANTLGITIRGSQYNVLDRRSVRQLALRVLESKRRSAKMIGGRGLVLTPSLVTALLLRLQARSAKFKRSMAPLLASKRVPRDGEEVFVLKSVAALKAADISVPLQSGGAALKVSLAVPQTFSKSTASDGEAEAVRVQVADLQRQIAELRRQVAAHGALISKQNSSNAKASDSNSELARISDCSEVKRRQLAPGLFFLTSIDRRALCTADGEVILLRRSRGNIDFNRSWAEYRDGFGDPASGDFFIGLRSLARYTSTGDRCMRLHLLSRGLIALSRVADYADFQVGDEDDGYKLSYSKFEGSVGSDGLSALKGRRFTTFDGYGDMQQRRCAASAGSGNWFASCGATNIFGRLLPRTKTASSHGPSGMCWTGLASGQSKSCAPLQSVAMTASAAGDVGKQMKNVFAITASCSGGCKSVLKEITIAASGTYQVAAGGGGGGDSYNAKIRGGRGALIRARFHLTKGTRLAVVAGCGGYPTTCNCCGGSGGNATILVDRSRKLLLLMAGGGGGAACYAPGLHGRAQEEGDDGWWRMCNHSPSPNRFYRRGSVVGGRGWKDVKNQLLEGAVNTQVTTGHGMKSPYRDGRGGGGYKPGASTMTGNHYQPGGGGGSFCNGAVSKECQIVEGGNTHVQGFVFLDKHACL